MIKQLVSVRLSSLIKICHAEVGNRFFIYIIYYAFIYAMNELAMSQKNIGNVRHVSGQFCREHGEYCGEYTGYCDECMEHQLW